MTSRSTNLPLRKRRTRRRSLLGWFLLLAIPLLLLGWLGYQGVYRSRQSARESAAPKIQARLKALVEVIATDFARDDGGQTRTKLRRVRTFSAVPEPVPVNEAQTAFAQAMTLGVENKRAQLEQIAVQFPNAHAASGLPLLVLVRWEQFQLEVAEEAKGNAPAENVEHARRDLEKAAVFTHPSSLSPELLDRADALLGQRGLLANSKFFWRLHETWRREFGELLAKTPGLVTPAWLGEGGHRVYVEDGLDGYAFLPLTEIQTWAENFFLLAQREEQITNADFGAALLSARSRPTTSESQDIEPPWSSMDNGLRYQLSLDGVALAQEAPRGEILAHAEAGKLAATAVVVDASLFFAEQDRQARWLAALLASALLAVAGAFIALSRALARERQLGELKSDFLSSVSHELRAPVASMRLMAENLVARTVIDERRQAEYHRLIADECRRLSALIGNVLDFARIEQGRQEYQFEETDLNALIADTVRLLNPRAEARRQTLQVSVKPLDQIPQVDGLAVQQALINLVDNALKFSPPESAITIGLKPRDATHWELSVADQGPGIAASEHERIFERFYRVGSELRRETPGAGIGLSLVKHLAESHGGRVEVQSEPGKGARFTLILPFSPTAKS